VKLRQRDLLTIYRYRSARLTIMYVVTMSAFVVFACLPFYIGGRRIGSLEVLPLFAWCVLFLMPAMSLGGMLVFYLRCRPLGIGDEGIATFMLGRRWKFIDWHNVKKVEKFRVYDSFFYEYRRVFLVSADGARIRFDDWIGDLPNLLATMNGYIAKYQIPVFAVDRGRDTLRGISGSAMDSIAQKKLLREGVRTTVSQL